MQRFVGCIAIKRGMRDSLRFLPESNSPLFAQTSGPVPLAFKRLMEKAVQAGTMRPDADSADVLHASSCNYSATHGPAWQDRPGARRPHHGPLSLRRCPGAKAGWQGALKSEPAICFYGSGL
jgi:hypothetical protein